VWGLFLGAVMVLAGAGSWEDSQSAYVTFEILLGPGLRALLAVVAGILLLAPRVRTGVAAGFLTGTAAAAGIGALTTMGKPIEKGGLESLLGGWWLAFVGQSLIAATGLVAAAVVAWRAPLPRGPIAWRDPGTYAVLATGGLTTILYLGYAGYVGSADGSGYGYYAATYYVWGLITPAIVLLSLAARPSAAGRLMALAWSVAVVGFALSEWLVLTSRSAESMGMPWLVVTGLLLAVAGGFIGRRAAPQ
jgi:hypothetical protein